MLQLAHTTPPSEHHQPELIHTVTTLGDLIEAINEEADSEEDYLVARAVSHLLETRRIRFLNRKCDLEIISSLE